jgi:hypothetical protein
MQKPQINDLFTRNAIKLNVNTLLRCAAIKNLAHGKGKSPYSEKRKIPAVLFFTRLSKKHGVF